MVVSDNALLRTISADECLRSLSHNPGCGLAEVLALVTLASPLRGGIFDARHLALTSFRDGFSRRALFLFRAGMAGFLFELVGLPL